MLTMKQRRPTFRTLRGWAITVLQDAGAIRECTSMPRCGTAPTLTPASAPSSSLGGIRPLAPPGSRRSRLSKMCWVRSATPARSALPNSLPAPL